jgi:hypothetical protein
VLLAQEVIDLGAKAPTAGVISVLDGIVLAKEKAQGDPRPCPIRRRGCLAQLYFEGRV